MKLKFFVCLAILVVFGIFVAFFDFNELQQNNDKSTTTTTTAMISVAGGKLPECEQRVIDLGLELELARQADTQRCPKCPVCDTNLAEFIPLAPIEDEQCTTELSSVREDLRRLQQSTKALSLHNEQLQKQISNNNNNNNDNDEDFQCKKEDSTASSSSNSKSISEIARQISKQNRKISTSSTTIDIINSDNDEKHLNDNDNDDDDDDEKEEDNSNQSESGVVVKNVENQQDCSLSSCVMTKLNMTFEQVLTSLTDKIQSLQLTMAKQENQFKVSEPSVL
jgi:hypothetical protein